MFTILVGWGCSGQGGPDRVDVPDHPGATKTAAQARAERRAYDGAPPVIPHEDFGMECLGCHVDDGVAVDDEGFAPPNPHLNTPGMSDESRCRQCHVFRTTDALFVETTFQGLRQDLRRGGRFYEGAPPVIPHRMFMREDCAGCHSGPAAREEIRTSHPERERCTQCHVQQITLSVFDRTESPSGDSR